MKKALLFCLLSFRGAVTTYIDFQNNWLNYLSNKWQLGWAVVNNVCRLLVYIFIQKI